ncbi:tetratricopeptide repeat protein [Neptuniibacter sp. QD72_48]|uniref:tetratricopeptide repeat protein n=1 Tax=unclassified Neptuniibacter TaxID=2630693 RepID=UPI0039F5E6CD
MKLETYRWLYAFMLSLAFVPISWGDNAVDQVSFDQALVEEEEDQNTSDLSYTAYIKSNKRIKCLYGYAADKTGDHQAAIAIFEDCIDRWNDVYSMLWLAQIYEAGVGVDRDLKKSTELMKLGAEQEDEAGYSSLARFHYGVALFEGIGTNINEQQAKQYLRRAAKEGIREACDYLKKQNLQCT